MTLTILAIQLTLKKTTSKVKKSIQGEIDAVIYFEEYEACKSKVTPEDEIILECNKCGVLMKCSRCSKSAVFVQHVANNAMLDYSK